jgi:K+-sensing histidine kinase KdpD
VRRRVIDRLAVVASVAVPAAAAAALVPLRDHTPNTSIALIMVVVVVILALPGNRLAAALGGLGAGVWFDFFFTRPYYSFSIALHNDLETTVLLLIVGVAVGELTARGRNWAARAYEASDDIARIHAVAEMVADGSDIDQVVLAVRNELQDLLSLRDCWFDPSFAERPGAFIERQGSVMWGDLRWEPSSIGLPSKEVSLIVQGQGRPFGRFVLVPTVGQPVSLDRLTVAVALADQVGAAMAARPDHV